MPDTRLLDEPTLMSPEAHAVEDEAIEERAERHAQDSGPLAPSRADQPRILFRSPAIWVLLLLTAAVVVGLAFMGSHLHPVDSGHVRGPGDEAAPNAPPGYKQRTP